ncbi:tRNA (adenosine(37)-N6)-threonylcarbamoyltransferase complex ATPase subunit type 1 TsaE [Propioniciclava coleopterorum]|uniref:tRNA threonylcarbamoyladenosine biosynthesis protein TsaE n=2 Tax=Propioniciclava coleopterorum TaxID=2714937 RepID=A0A6G7YA55_9ACTN|nr:tRNA (adenosine(37)-N6)-threonylcarbamoyltransferase complex ATPase subunit type 1 TsaE [Propioniciclava coleopterorum]
MRTLGRRLAGLLRAGDLIIASGELGAGKTTFTQGLGAGLDVDGPIISPTFVLARIHPPRTGGPTLVHVDAYRLGDAAELEDLDLEESLADSVTLVEWGTGVAEGLASDRLDVDIRRGTDPDDETRWVFVTPHGDRWDRARLAAALEEDA